MNNLYIKYFSKTGLNMHSVFFKVTKITCTFKPTKSYFKYFIKLQTIILTFPLSFSKGIISVLSEY